MAQQPPKKRNTSGRMTLGQHLVELRKRLFISAIAIVCAGVAGWLLSGWVWDMLREPIIALELQGRTATITYNDITSGFDLKMRVSLFIAVLIASPVWLYQLWAFLAPGLTRREKLYGVGFLAAAVPLFLGGAYIGWLIMPNIIRLLASFQPIEDSFFLTARSYLDFAVKFLLAIGIGFVLPVLLVMLNMIGVLSGKTILKNWRVAILIITLFAAMATPSVDVLSMFLLALPMTLLYMIAAVIAVLHDRRLEKRRAAELGAALGDDSGQPVVEAQQ